MNSVPASIMQASRDVLDNGASRIANKNLARMVERLQKVSGTEDLSGCTEMSLQDGSDFCWNPWGDRQTLRNRAAILRRFRFPHSDELEAMMASAVQVRAEWVRLGQTTHPQYFRIYIDLAKWLGPFPRTECERLTEEQLALLVRGAEEWTRTHFTVLKQTLTSVGRAEVVGALERSLHPDLTAGSAQAWLCALSAWHEAALPKMVQSFCDHHHGRASFERNRRESDGKAWRTCLKLHAATKELAPPNIGNDPLRWFVETCDDGLVQRALVLMLQTCVAQNDRVCSTSNSHHVKAQCGFGLSFMKHGLVALRPDLDLGSISHQKILQKIPNQRIPADGTTRRMLTLEEAERIIQAARNCNDAQATLILVLLSEIGLRRSALCHLKYSNLLDRTHTPLCTGRAFEKGRKWRFFITSTRLKQAIKSYAETVRGVADVHSDGEFYLLNPQQPERPLGDVKLGRIVGHYTKKAGVTEIRVHPHMFRHSIVGWLIDAGNSMEVASKYMGHACVSTTAEHYWVPSTTELFSKINNPFTGEMQQKQREAKQVEQELELLQGKLDGALHIIAQMDAVVRTAVASNLTAPQVQDAMARIPNRDAILRTILESTSASLTAASLPAPVEPLEGITEDDDASQKNEGSACSVESEGEEESTGDSTNDTESCETAPANNESPSRKRHRK